MRKNKKILMIVLIALFLMTGCTKQLKDAKGKVVKDDETKQVLIENVLCQPIDLKDKYNETINNNKKEYKKLYESGDLSKKEYNKKIDNLLNIDKLPKCTKISVVEGGYETLWTSVFVKPLAWLIVKIGMFLKNSYGLSIILVTLLIKIVLFPLTNKTLKQSENLKKAQPKLSKIEKKYANKTDQESMMMKSNEMMAIYKEYKINPMGGCILAFLQVPLFFAFYEALNRLPVLFEGKFLGLSMGMTPIAALENNYWFYLLLPIIVGLVTYFSFKINNSASTNPGQEKQMKMMFNIMVIMIFVTSFSMSTAIILYWVTNSAFTIVQNLIVKRSK